MEKNSLFHGRYLLDSLLGRGNFSEVWKAKDTKTDIEVALKIYAPATGLDDEGLNIFAREFSLVVNVNHKNLLKPLFYDTFDHKPYLVLPYCERGSIMKMIGGFTEKEAWRLMRDISGGLAWLHAMNPPVIHQDVKPGNIMLSNNGNFMLADFGISTRLRTTLRKSLSLAFSSAGTVSYMAPERFGKDNTPIMANDIYSLGATVFEMLTGNTPFGDDGGLIQKKGAEIPELKGNYSQQLKKVVTKCLSDKPWERPAADQLEKYATTGLEGKNIIFTDEQNVWQKHKRLFITSILVIVTCILAIFIGFNAWNNKTTAIAKEQEQAETIKAQNDSILTEIKKLVAAGDSLYAVGLIHDEGYETAFIEAYNNYDNAISSGYNLQNGIKIPNEDGIKNKMHNVELKLYDAYISIQEKAKVFADDKEIYNEFKERAANISSV
ncbi:MAG: serine/threonine-protein kinase, partial [Prevotellaceae bacterium]|nr:serine/threonine-protein kinase [Prevotellaceae bacterium]